MNETEASINRRSLLRSEMHRSGRLGHPHHGCRAFSTLRPWQPFRGYRVPWPTRFARKNTSLTRHTMIPSGGTVKYTFPEIFHSSKKSWRSYIFTSAVFISFIYFYSSTVVSDQIALLLLKSPSTLAWSHSDPRSSLSSNSFQLYVVIIYRTLLLYSAEGIRSNRVPSRGKCAAQTVA